MPFSDRKEAGRALADALVDLDLNNPLVLALPRGGVPVAYEIARRLHAPLDILIVRKLGAPMNEEFAIGALVEGRVNQFVLMDETIRRLNVSEAYLDEVMQKEGLELQRRQERYRGSRAAPPDVRGKSVILVDDGIATGATVQAALKAIRLAEPEAIILAVPVAPPDTLEKLQPSVDRCIALQTPEPFWAVGAYYKNFDQTSDAEVIALLKQAASAL